MHTRPINKVYKTIAVPLLTLIRKIKDLYANKFQRSLQWLVIKLNNRNNAAIEQQIGLI